MCIYIYIYIYVKARQLVVPKFGTLIYNYNFVRKALLPSHVNLYIIIIKQKLAFFWGWFV